MEKKIRVLIAKPGLDGHDRGALVIAQGLRDEGMEVIYSGLRQTPEQIVAAAIQEDVDCIGMSILSGAHNELFPEVTRLLKENSAEDILVIGGGIIPEEDISFLQEQGIEGIFNPGTAISQIAGFIREKIQHKDIKKNLTKIQKVDHIGIAVHSLNEAIPFFQSVLGLELLKIERVEEEGVQIAFFQVGEVKLELLEPISENSPIRKHLEKRGEGIHHLAFQVEDIMGIFAKMKEHNIPLLQEQPRIGADNQQVGFVSPKATHKTLIEFCQDKTVRLF